MRLGITAKLFLGVLATGILVALVMALTRQLMFQRDFYDYVEAAEQRRVVALAETLAELYAETRDWSALQGAEPRWRALLHATPLATDPATGSLIDSAAGGWPLVALYDADDHPIAGFVGVDGDTAREPVMVNGQVVGWIARSRWRGPTEDADLQFQRNQLRNLGVAAIAAALFAALAAWLLSRTFLAPARAIGAATHRLVAGDFSARVPRSGTDEFGQLAEDFNLLARTLQRNEEMRRRMMADVAHELRTPLAVIAGELAAIEDGIRQFGPDALASLQAEVRSLGKLVEDLYQLALSDLGALDYRREDLELRTELSALLPALRERCEANGLTLEDAGLAGPPLPVHADPDRLAQLVHNLAANSIRYTDAPGIIEVACRATEGLAVLEWHDSAPGIPREQLPRVFERFFRMEASRSRAAGGAGLGLAICRNIVDAHDGTIEASISPLGGLAITITLPLQKTIT